VGLHDIRKKMAIIPQDSFIFSGSLAFNVDPFNQFTNKEIFNILKKICFVDTMIKNDSQNLNIPDVRWILINSIILMKYLKQIISNLKIKKQISPQRSK
jgi:ABC-type multidrug transport system fused ATPase/permease subunit